MERVGAVVGAALALGTAGCGSQPPPEADDAPDDDAFGSLIDEEGFEIAPEVAFPAPATTRFGNGHRLCTEHRSEISPEAARVLGYDVAGDRAALEATQVFEVLASASDLPPTVVHHRGRIRRIVRVDRDPPADVPVEETLPAGCPNGVEYELLQQLYTEDGAVRGAFLAHVPATELDEPTARVLFAEVDLRNFTGELPVYWTDAPVYGFATAQVRWSVGRVEATQFELTPTVWAAPVSDGCNWGFCRDDSDIVLPSSFGLRLRADLLNLPVEIAIGEEIFPTLGFTVRSLTEVQARTVYTPDVHLWVTASGANTADGSSASRVHFTARADGLQIAGRALDLLPNPNHAPDGIIGGYIDVGPLPEGTLVELDVRDEFRLGSIRSHIVVDHCDVARATAACLEPGCAAATSLAIVPSGCRYARPFDAR